MNLNKLSNKITDRISFRDSLGANLNQGDIVFLYTINKIGLFEYSYFVDEKKIMPGVIVHKYENDTKIPATTGKSRYSNKFTAEYILDKNFNPTSEEDIYLSMFKLNIENLKEHYSIEKLKEILKVQEQIKTINEDQSYVYESF